MKFIETPLLRIGYKEWNPEGPRTVVLTHGWPDSLRCWHNVVPALVDAGYRVLAPALRGFLPTTFLREDTPRTGQLAALGRDMVDFVQALQLDQPCWWGMTGARVRWPMPAAWHLDWPVTWFCCRWAMAPTTLHKA
jgi:pimeloyl-ACP methyl ester carboxylesterase